MTLTQRITELVAAGFSGLWIQTAEPDEAQRELFKLAHAHGWNIATWDIDQGTTRPGTPPDQNDDPLAPLRILESMAGNQPALMILHNYDRFTNSPKIAQTLANRITAGKHSQTFAIVLAPVVAIPAALEKLFVVVEHDLPTRDELAAIAAGLAQSGEEADDPSAILDAASGLTRYEAESAFALSIIRKQKLDPAALWEHKTGALKKSGLLSLHRSIQGFDSLGGLSAMKEFARRSLNGEKRDRRNRAKGLFLCGVPGTGKSAFCQALGHETGRPTITLDPGALMGSLVGQTEQNTRRALQIIDAMAPAILFIDEIEKALAGMNSSGQTDSGVSARQGGALLTWLNDHESDIYTVCTSNDATKLPHEFTRAERFDALFFLDTPSRADCEQIWQLYLAAFELDPKQARPNGENWTGAEIRACCRLAALLQVPLTEAATNIVPIATTAAETVGRLQQWATGRALDASAGGIYTSRKTASNNGTTGRVIQRAARGTSAN